MNNSRLPFLYEKSHGLPLLPGVYIMKDSSGKIIYIGKAKALKNRVSSYFRSVEKHQEKVYQMVEHVYDFDYIITDSEFEALVLECSLIKQYTPKYNILLKDDKGYHYIKIAPERFGRITAQKQKLDEEGATYLGPYTSSYTVRESVDEANKAFMLPTCNRKFPEDFRKGRPCLNYHIKQCMGVCTGKISEEEYNEVLQEAIGFLKGSSTSTVRILTEKMEQAAENLEFEKAARLRDRIHALNKLSEKQKVVMSKVEDQDVIAFAQGIKMACAAVLKFRGGKLVDKEDFILPDIESLQEARAEFLHRYYSIKDYVPKQLTLDEETGEEELLAQFLSDKRGNKVTVSIPKIGDQQKLVTMARENAAERLSKETPITGREVAALDELARLLGLPHPPRYIESYDISNWGSEAMVAGMVVFENARPLKSAYKRFSIKTLSGPDDYASMREVISRRIARYFEEKDRGEGFGRLPDLILLDGGKGHVSAIRPLIEQAGLNIPVYGMVKDDRHRTRAIAEDGGEIAINSNRSAFTLVSKIQDEVHRFAISYQRTKHRGRAFSSTLTQIEGIGEAKAKALLKHFKTIGAIKEAQPEALSNVSGISLELAQRIFDYFHTDNP